MNRETHRELTVDSTAHRVATLSLMAFFPNDSDARAALIRILMRVVETEEQLDWLIERALDLYPRWPGLGELRALYCSRYRPKDGVEAYSEIYEGSIAKFGKKEGGRWNCV